MGPVLPGPSWPEIVHLIAQLRPCGPVNVLFALAKESWNRGTPLTIFTLHSESEPSLIEAFRPFVNDILCLGIDRATEWFKGVGRLRCLLGSRKASILHSHGIKADLLSAMLGRGAREIRVATVHSNLPEDYRHSFGRMKGFAFCRFHYRLLDRLDVVVPVSEAVKKGLAPWIARPLRRIYNGVDRPVPLPFSGGWPVLRNLDLPERTPIAMTVGHLTRLKNVVALAELLARLDAGIDLFAVFLGSGPERLRCQNLLDAAGRGRCEGAVTNVADYLASANLYISASKSEGMPMAALEAMAAGLPMILSDIDAHREISLLLPNKILLFNPEDPADFSKKLSHLLVGTPKAGDSEVMELFELQFSSGQMTENYLQLYAELLDRGSND